MDRNHSPMERFSFKISAAQLAQLKALGDDNEVSTAWVARKCIDEGLRRIASGDLQLPLPFKEE